MDTTEHLSIHRSVPVWAYKLDTGVSMSNKDKGNVEKKL